MVVLNNSLQIIGNSMEEKIVVYNRGGGCIVKNSPLFSADGKYVYILCKWCVSAYSIQTGECVHQFVSENKEELVHFTTYEQYLFSITASGNLTTWKTITTNPEKIKKLKLKDDSMVVRIFAVKLQKKTDINLVLVLKEKDKKDLRLYLYSLKGKKSRSNLHLWAEDKPHSVAVCDELYAGFILDRLVVAFFGKDAKKTNMLAGGGRVWTVVACAPEGRGLAAGDNSGRILYWPQPLRRETRIVFHWHTLPVTALAFSPSGSYMYSGGGEMVMVRWNVEVSNVRNFLPRLPAPILHLAVSPDNQYVAIATQDNGIQIADSQNRVSSVIQRLAWGVSPIAKDEETLFPTGLVWDPRSKSLVLNGRPGHVQFFNPEDNKLLYNLDITGQNYISQERHKEVINAEVTHVGISHDGNWMVTIETQDDGDIFLETLLKFWQYKFNARQFSLNTCVQVPHQGKVNKIRFQPSGTMPDQYLLVTTGADGKFRIWIPSTSESIHTEGEGLSWVCDSVGYYRSLTPDCIAFSTDGSVLGVTFDATLTLWDAEVSKLNTSLTRDNNKLKAVEFGTQHCCHLVVTASDLHLNVWNILNISVIWTVSANVSLLCADPCSTNMAVFTTDNSVYVFSPGSPKILYEKKNVCSPQRRVLATIFVPRPKTLLDTNAPWCANSQLHFIDSDQELRYFELESEQDPEQVFQGLLNANSPATPFSIMVAKQSASEVDKSQGITHVQFGTPDSAAVRKLLRNPAHVMPNMRLFCASFLKSLVLTRAIEEERRQKDESEKEEKMEDDEDSSGTDAENSQSLLLMGKKQKHKESEGDELNKSHTKEINEIPLKKKQRRKSVKEKKPPKKKDNSFSIDDLDTDWLSKFEDR